VKDQLNRKNGLILLITLIFLITYSCGGGGDSNGGGVSGQSTINGRVQQVIAEKIDGDQGTLLSKIRDLIMIVKNANAQGEITITASINGQIIDTTVTGPSGDFTLVVPGGGVVTITFSTTEFSITIDIFVPENSEINISFTLQPNNMNEPVMVEEEIVNGSIRCENGTVEINSAELMVDGLNSGECIRTAGNCNLIINSTYVSLTNCDRCIDARGTSNITIMGEVICDAFGDGIRARGNSDVSIDAGMANIEICGGVNGIRADGNPTVNLAGNVCTIIGGENPIRINGNADVNTEGCVTAIDDCQPVATPMPSPTP